MMLYNVYRMSVVSAFIGAAALTATAPPALARGWTCNKTAAGCLEKAVRNGYNRAEWQRKCFEPTRMANCRRTGLYHAPSGKVWPASGR
jgi:hypothetical protein